MSMVEPKEVALLSGESLVPTEQQGCTLTPIGGLKNEWKRSVFTEKVIGNKFNFCLPKMTSGHT
jgi:hypothetical protein